MNEDVRAKYVTLLADALDRLPKSADGIAAYFAEVGIRGVGGSLVARTCPVAVYLHGTFPDDTPSASAGQVGVWDGDGTTGKILAVAPTPPHVDDFIRRFDTRCYPDLRA